MENVYPNNALQRSYSRSVGRANIDYAAFVASGLGVVTELGVFWGVDFGGMDSARSRG